MRPDPASTGERRLPVTELVFVAFGLGITVIALIHIFTSAATTQPNGERGATQDEVQQTTAPTVAQDHSDIQAIDVDDGRSEVDAWSRDG